MNSGTTLYEEAVALRAEVREVVILLENWTQTATVTTRAGGCEPLPAASAPMMARPEGQE